MPVAASWTQLEEEISLGEANATCPPGLQSTPVVNAFSCQHLIALFPGNRVPWEERAVATLLANWLRDLETVAPEWTGRIDRYLNQYL